MADEATEMNESSNVGKASHETPAGGELHTREYFVLLFLHMNPQVVLQ